jgi:hypothetical protein
MIEKDYLFSVVYAIYKGSMPTLSDTVKIFIGARDSFVSLGRSPLNAYICDQTCFKLGP